jgi:hypothetical protein
MMGGWVPVRRLPVLTAPGTFPADTSPDCGLSGGVPGLAC